MPQSSTFDPSTAASSHFASRTLAASTLAASSFAYAGEGPEIGKSYGYKITGFVTHDAPRPIDSLRSRLGSAKARFVAGLTSAFAIVRGVWMRLPPLPIAAGRPAALGWETLAQPLLQRFTTIVVRYPGTLLALMLATFLSSLLLRGETGPAPDLSEAALELRLSTGSIGTLPSERGGATASLEAMRSASWKPMKGRALPIFALEAPDLAAFAPRYAIETRGEAREDSLIWSEQKASEDRWPALAPLVLLVAQRELGPGAEPASLYLETTRRAARHGLSVMRSSVSSEIGTKFGTVEVADVILSADAATPEEQSRSCLAFRHAKDPALFRLTGWFCAPRDRVVVRPALAAFIDRLSLIGASGDDRLHRVFVEADLARAAAAQRRPGKPLPWLDQTGEKPQLKGERPSRAGGKHS